MDCCIWMSIRRKKGTRLSKKYIFFFHLEDKISQFQSTQLHHGRLKKTVLPYEERQEHSWKKNDFCTAWVRVIPPDSCCSSSLHRLEPKTFVFSGCPYVQDASSPQTFFRCFPLWMQNLKDAGGKKIMLRVKVIIIWLKFQCDLVWNDSWLGFCSF